MWSWLPLLRFWFPPSLQSPSILQAGDRRPVCGSLLLNDTTLQSGLITWPPKGKWCFKPAIMLSPRWQAMWHAGSTGWKCKKGCRPALTNLYSCSWSITVRWTMPTLQMISSPSSNNVAPSKTILWHSTILLYHYQNCRRRTKCMPLCMAWSCTFISLLRPSNRPWPPLRFMT